jgi:hypothetical protein
MSSLTPAPVPTKLARMPRSYSANRLVQAKTIQAMAMILWEFKPIGPYKHLHIHTCNALLGKKDKIKNTFFVWRKDYMFCDVFL